MHAYMAMHATKAFKNVKLALSHTHTHTHRVCCHSLQPDYISDIASAIIRFCGNEVSTAACCCRWDDVCVCL